MQNPVMFKLIFISGLSPPYPDTQEMCTLALALSLVGSKLGLKDGRNNNYTGGIISVFLEESLTPERIIRGSQNPALSIKYYRNIYWTYF